MHKVFISYHHRNDQPYKDHLVQLNQLHHIFIDKSVNTDDIPDHLPPQTIRKKIRDEYLRDSTVTILLLGEETKFRKHIDWELHSSMIDGPINKKSGILVVTLPDIRCPNWHTSHDGEQKKIYPEYHDWDHNIPTKTDCLERYPNMPQRIIDNLANPNADISVVPWSKIEANPSNLDFLITATSTSSFTNQYVFNEPMRMRDHNPHPFRV